MRECQRVVTNSVKRLTKTAISKQIVFNNDFKSVSSQRKPVKECTRHPNVRIAENIYEKKLCYRPPADMIAVQEIVTAKRNLGTDGMEHSP